MAYDNNQQTRGNAGAPATPSAPSDIQAAITAGMGLGQPQFVSEKLALVLTPAGSQVQKIDLQQFEDQYMDNPRRKTGARDLATAASFIAYVNAHKLPSTAIYADKDCTRFEAVFNDHEPEPRERTIAHLESAEQRQEAPQQAVEAAEGIEQEAAAEGIRVHLVRVQYDTMGAPGWGDFKATYACPQSVEWKRWMGKSQHAADEKRGMRHTEFIQFLEDNLLDVTNPPSGQLLQSVLSFEAKKDVAFKSATRLQDGSIAFNYTENVAQVPQEGRLSLPEQFSITIPVFDGGAKYVLDARLRYRVSGGGLSLWYELVSPHKVLEHAFNTVQEEITKGVEDVPVYRV